jgi:rod shape-determining protein MreC
MISFIKRYRLPIVIALLILIPLFNLSSSLKSPKDLKWYDRVVLWFTSPVQKAITVSFNSVVGFTNHYVLLVSVKKENDKLVKENNKLVEVVNNMREIDRENTRLRKLLAFKQRYLPAGVSVEVIARDTTSEYQTVRINKGHDVGLRARMPVITPAGVVGQLINVWANYSDVLLMTDHNHAIDVIVQRSRARGVLKGGLKPYCELSYVNRTDDVAVGDVLVTSGIEGIFPKGLLVGTVLDVDKKLYGVTQKVVVRPTVNLNKLEEAFVVTNLLGVRFSSTDNDG